MDVHCRFSVKNHLLQLKKETLKLEVLFDFSFKGKGDETLQLLLWCFPFNRLKSFLQQPPSTTSSRNFLKCNTQNLTLRFSEFRTLGSHGLKQFRKLENLLNLHMIWTIILLTRMGSYPPPRWTGPVRPLSFFVGIPSSSWQNILFYYC